MTEETAKVTDETIHRYRIGDVIYKNKAHMERTVRELLYRIGPVDSIYDYNTKYFEYIKLLCLRHPYHKEKLSLFKDFKINYGFINKKSLELTIVNNDGTFTVISWLICVAAKCRPDKFLFNQSLRESIKYQTFDFKKNAIISCCVGCNCLLEDGDYDVDHLVHFEKLVIDFMKLNNKIIIPNRYGKDEVSYHPLFLPEDSWIGLLFAEYHQINSSLRILCKHCNKTRSKYVKI